MINTYTSSCLRFNTPYTLNAFPVEFSPENKTSKASSRISAPSSHRYLIKPFLERNNQILNSRLLRGLPRTSEMRDQVEVPLLLWGNSTSNGLGNNVSVEFRTAIRGSVIFYSALK